MTNLLTSVTRVWTSPSIYCKSMQYVIHTAFFASHASMTKGYVELIGPETQANYND